jgi:hypothetical protein
MTQGETLFYLREIQSHWSTSNVSRDKLAELEAAKLIEINTVPFIAVRLTSEGARLKTAGRPPASNGKGINVKRNRTQRRPQKKVITRPKAMV